MKAQISVLLAYLSHLQPWQPSAQTQEICTNHVITHTHIKKCHEQRRNSKVVSVKILSFQLIEFHTLHLTDNSKLFSWPKCGALVKDRQNWLHEEKKHYVSGFPKAHTRVIYSSSSMGPVCASPLVWSCCGTSEVRCCIFTSGPVSARARDQPVPAGSGLKRISVHLERRG